MKLKSILIHLIGNSIKFTKNGSITIFYELDTTNFNNVNLTISDTGIGISEAQKNSIT